MDEVLNQTIALLVDGWAHSGCKIQNCKAHFLDSSSMFTDPGSALFGGKSYIQPWQEHVSVKPDTANNMVFM